MMQAITVTINHLGLTGVFLVMVVENLGIPFPTEVGFLVAQGQIQAGQLTYPAAITLITLGHVVGACLAYGIGRWGDRKLTGIFERNRHWKEVQERVVRWYARYGNVTVFTTRLIGYVRPWSSLVAGFARLPMVPFVIWTTLGSLIFSSVSLYITRYIIAVWLAYPQFHTEMLIIIFLLFFSILITQIGRSLYGKIRHRQP